MAKKIKKASQPGIPLHEPKPFAAAYAARLEKQVNQGLSTSRRASILPKRKALGTGK